MKKEFQKEINKRLLLVISDLEKQKSVGSSYSDTVLPFSDEMKQIHEWIEEVNECEN